MTRPWEASPSASFSRRLGKSPRELGTTNDRPACPDIWELSNGDIAIIGRDLTRNYIGQLPDDVSVQDDERVVVIPGITLRAAKADISDD